MNRRDAYRARMRAEGKCGNCGRKRERPERVNCDDCHERKRAQGQAKRDSMRIRA